MSTAALLLRARWKDQLSDKLNQISPHSFDETLQTGRRFHFFWHRFRQWRAGRPRPRAPGPQTAGHGSRRERPPGARWGAGGNSGRHLDVEKRVDDLGAFSSSLAGGGWDSRFGGIVDQFADDDQFAAVVVVVFAELNQRVDVDSAVQV
uniref:Uncharacterized protein n=1 Tax=Romanomermis culicivorax TaxID=13658 RepID=A0A915JWX3_ROMCU